MTTIDRDEMDHNFDKFEQILHRRAEEEELREEEERLNAGVGLEEAPLGCTCIPPPSDPLIKSMIYEASYCTCGRGKPNFDPVRRLHTAETGVHFKHPIRNGPAPFTAPPGGEPSSLREKLYTAPVPDLVPEVKYERGIPPGNQFEKDLFSMAIRQKVYKDRYVDPKTGNVFTFDVQVDSRGVVMGNKNYEGKL